MNVLKKSGLSILLITFVFSILGQSNQEGLTEESKNQFFILPTSLADKIVQFGYERSLKNKNSIMVQLGAYINGSNVLEKATIEGTGIRSELNYNLLFDNLTNNRNNALNFYVSPYINYFNSTFTIGKDYYNEEYATESFYDDSTATNISYLTNDSIINNGKANISHIGLGTLIGLKWTVSQKIVFDFYLGGGYQKAFYSGESFFRKPLQNEFIGNFTTTGVLGRVGIRVGINF